MSDLKIYPLKNMEDRMNRLDKYPLASIPAFIAVVGAVRSGKTLLVNNLILRFYRKDFDHIIIFSPTIRNDPVNKHLIDEADFVFEEYTEELLKEIIAMIEADESDARYLLVLDDIIGAVRQKKSGDVDYITSLATKYRHIGNTKFEGKLSIILICQYFKYLNPIIRQNCSAYYLMGKYSGNELKKISDALSYFGGSDSAFMEIYKKSKKEKYDFLFLNVGAMEARRNHDEIIWKEEDDMVKDEPEEEIEEVEDIIENKKKE